MKLNKREDTVIDVINAQLTFDIKVKCQVQNQDQVKEGKTVPISSHPHFL